MGSPIVYGLARRGFDLSITVSPMSRKTYKNLSTALGPKNQKRTSSQRTKSSSRLERWDLLHLDYCDEYADIAKQMTVLNFDNEDIRNVIGIRGPTFESWKLLHPPFKEALSQTTLASGLMTLIKQAVGYFYETEHIHDLPLSIPMVEYRTRYRRPSRKALYTLMKVWPTDEGKKVKRKDIKVPPSMIDAHQEHEAQRQFFKGQVQTLKRSPNH
jgi:hypothetical protein